MKFYSKFAVAAATALLSSPALAHHPLGGKTPANFSEGLLSGIGHPIVGLDHLAFVVAVGIAAVALGYRFLLPLAFVVATLIGTGLHIAAIDLPMVEAVISLSVLTAGVLLMTGRHLPIVVFAGLFAIAGLFHGHAYGEAIFGAETTPLYAYLAGFGLTQYAIAVLSGTAIVSVLGKAQPFISNIPARVASGMVAGAGALLVGEKAIAAVLGG